MSGMEEMFLPAKHFTRMACLPPGVGGEVLQTSSAFALLSNVISFKCVCVCIHMYIYDFSCFSWCCSLFSLSCAPVLPVFQVGHMRSCGHPPWLQSRTLRKSRTKVSFLLLLSLKLENISLEAMDKLLQAFLPFSGFKISLLFHSCLRYGLQMTLYCSGVSMYHLTLGAAGINLGSCDQRAKKLADHAQGISCGC